ncbi:hypothetical protein AGR1A_Lc80270 [Agrobacterium fabacearum CFBP 5771]|uniref:hypothetical protein n=1 Tax=Agrobacterium tumefaciens TaxID=358 RepID=UPI0009C8197B|nr:hypothetical protein [Agrobacterium tumefaciens]CVI22721.1 hypothetical protein AGR1A_Lc80270 [Agrobacterium fabacearum CFBP 5771]
MSETVKYDVLREHEGDRFYRSGETRELKKVEAKHLVELGVLGEHDPERWKGSQFQSATQTVEARKAEIDDLLVLENNRLADAQKLTADALTKLQDDLNEARANAEKEASGIAETVSEARKMADIDLKEIKEMVEKARTDADAEVEKIKAGTEKAKAEAKVANKAEQVPSNKAV